MMPAWLEALAMLDRAGERSVLVTVVTARGSTPREAGCKMVVTRDSLFDTIGGGNLEFACIDVARDMLDGTPGPTTRDFPLGPALGQCCGGHVSVLFEPMCPARLHVALFGAGHVGRALVRLLADLPVRVTWIDSRPDAFPPSRPPGVATIIAADPASEITHLPAGTLVLVMTHDHQIDFTITAAALARTDFAAVGLIGSATKRARFVRRLASCVLDAAAIGRLICPIGLPGIGGKPPAEIAISVAAQILRFYSMEQDYAERGSPGTGTVSERSGSHGDGHPRADRQDRTGRSTGGTVASACAATATSDGTTQIAAMATTTPTACAACRLGTGASA